MPNEDLYSVDLVDQPPGQEDLYKVDLLDEPPGQDDLSQVELLDEPPQPAAPGPQPGPPAAPGESAFAFPASPYRQKPLPLPSEVPAPKPAEVQSKVDKMAEIMATWGKEGRPGHPTKQDVQDTIDIFRQAHIGLQQAPFKLSESSQNALAWMSEFFAQTATGPNYGAWAPSQSPEEQQKTKEWWRGISNHFRETGQIPKAYTDALDIIGEATPGPREVRQVAAATGSVVPSLAVAPIGFPAMVAMAGIQSAGDTFNEALEQRIANGQDEESARQAATADGLIGGMTTALVTAAFGRTGKEVITAVRSNAQAKGALVKIFKESGLEATEEMVDQALQAIREVMTYRPDLTLPEAVKEVMMAGAGGLVAGGGVISGIEASQAITQRAGQRAELAKLQKMVGDLVTTGPQAEMRQVPVRGPLGETLNIQVPIQPSPVRGTTQEALPPVPGVEGAQVVNQALSVGLPQTAQAVAAGRRTAVQAVTGEPAVAPQLDLTAGQVAEQITPGAPATPASTQAAQPIPSAAPAAAPSVTPEAAQGAPGVSPAPAPTPAPGVTRESISEPTPAPITSEQAIGLQTNLQREYSQISHRLNVVENSDQFPTAVQQDLARRGLEAKDVDAVFHNGRVIFNASQFPVGDPALVREKVTHEVAIHLGLREALGPQEFTRLTASIWKNLSANDRATVAARNRINVDDIWQIGEEWLAYEAERVVASGTVTPLWRKLANAIRATMRRLGFKRKYTDFEIAQMIEKGLRAAEATPSEVRSTATRLAAVPEYPAGSPLAQLDTIRYSFADVERAALEGERAYTPEIINAGMEGAFEGVKKMLYNEALVLSDLIPPSTPWHQPRQGASLIEYLRQFYSAEGVATLRETFAGDRPPRFVKDKQNWHAIKAELNNVQKLEEGGAIGLASTFLAMNRKTGGLSWDFGLGTCMPTENCSVCYAKGVTNPMASTKARTRHSIVTALEPQRVGGMIAEYIRSRPKRDQAFLRVNGAGDTTFPWQATAVNTAIANLDRPVHIFSRSHVSRAPGTIGLDSISNGQYRMGDIENGVAVFKMGSLDRQLVREYGIPFLRGNLEERGIINSYLVKDVEDIPVILQLKEAGVHLVLHINRRNEVVNALADAGLLAGTGNPELETPSCYCALESGPFLNGCATCLVGGGPCFAMGSTIAMTPEGQYIDLNNLLSGEKIPPNTRVVEMSRVGQPKDRVQVEANAAARSYEMAATEIERAIVKFENGRSDKVIIKNPRSRETILHATTKAQVKVARQIADDWSAYAKWLQGVSERYENSSGFHRYVAKYEMEKAISTDRAITEGIASAKRAVQRANTRLSVTSGKPNRQPAEVMAMPIADFATWAKTIPDGITGEAVRVGRAVTTQEGIDELQQLQAQAKAESSELMKAADFENAMAAATRTQYFREAYETATSTGSMAYAQKTGRILGGADDQPHTASEEGPPPGSTETDKEIPSKPDVSFPEHDDDYNTRYSVSRRPDPNFDFLPIRNASMEKALQDLGIARSLPEALGKPDSQLLRDVQQRMARDPTWVDSIVDREQKKPGLLTDEEVMALDYWMLELRTEIYNASRKAEEAEAAGDMADAAGYRRQVEFWSESLVDLSEVTKRSGTESARAFRARQLATKWDFTLDALYHEKRKAQGWKRLSADERAEMIAELQKKADQFQEANAKLEAENQKLRQRDVDAELRKAEAEVAQINPEVMKFAEDWVAEYNKSAKNAKDRLRVKWSRAFPGSDIRASVTGEPAPLPDELMRELAIIGGSKLAANITEPAAWEKAMIDELGPNVGPYLGAARQAAEAHFAARIASGRADLRATRAPRKVPGAPGAQPTVEQEIDTIKTKIHQVAERQKTTTEPIKTAEDELYYPVQRLVRKLIEQDPLITREELIAAVHEVLTVDFPNMTVEETMDTISGRGRVRRPAQDVTSKTIRDLKAQIRILANINDTEAQRATKRTGFQPDKPSDEQRRLEQRLNRAKKIHGEVVTDPQYQLSSYLDSRKTWYRNRIADLQWEIDEKRLIREGQPDDQRQKTDAELDALREEYERLRVEHAEIFQRPELTDEQRLELAEKAAERIILKMEDDLANGRRTAAGKRDPVASAKLEALRQRIAQLKAEQEWAQRQMNPPPDLTEAEDYKRWFQLDRQIRKIQLELASGNVFPVSKKIRPEDKPSNQRMAEELERLKVERQEMRDRLGPGKLDPVTKAINLRVAQLQRQVADYQERLANRDFEPRKRKEPPEAVARNPEVLRLLAERERIKTEFYNELNRDRWEKKNLRQKLWHGIQLTRTAVTNLRSSFDFSGARQGLVALLSMGSRIPFSRNPIKISQRVAKAFGQMFQAALSRTKADQINQAIRLKPNYKSGAYNIMGVEFSDIESPTFTRSEENARSVFDEWAKMPFWTGKPLRNLAAAPFKALAKPVAGSNRAFATFLNVLRSELADTILEANYSDRPPSENELRILGHYVNVATGRGYIKPSRAPGYSNFIWAPKLLASRIQFLTGQPLWGSGDYKQSARARKIIAKEYARVLSTAAMLYLISRMFDEKDERDPRSSDFGKIVRGNTRIDIWGGFVQPLVLISRAATNRTKTLKGRVIDFAAADAYGQGDLVDVGVRFVRSKLRPDVGVAVDLFARQDFLGRPTTPANVLRDLFVPLPFADIVDIMKDRGFTEGMILNVMNQFGAGINTYEEETKYPRETRTQ